MCLFDTAHFEVLIEIFKNVCNVPFLTLHTAETLAMIEALDCALFINKVLSLILGLKLDVHGNFDSKLLHDAILSDKHVLEKRLRTDKGAIKGMISRDELKNVHWVSTNKQVADGLTKKAVMIVGLSY